MGRLGLVCAIALGLGTRLLAEDPKRVDPPGGYRAGDSFDQSVTVTRRSDFRILGINTTQAASYQFMSSVVVSKVHADGSLSVDQTIRSAKLLDATREHQAELTATLAKTPGTKFELTISPTGDVKSWQAPKEALRLQIGQQAALGGQSLRVWSLLDADAWKELTGLTFFQPDKPLERDTTWTRPVSHDWGSLGSWRGKTGYRVVPKPSTKPGAKLLPDRIDYVHDLYYRPPGPGTDKDLPFRIVQAEFKIVQARGAILYDRTMRRTSAAEETFRVRGLVAVNLAGTAVAIELEETQSFRLDILDRTQRELVGQPIPKK